jgi:hypothetical protein
VTLLARACTVHPCLDLLACQLRVRTEPGRENKTSTPSFLCRSECGL